MKKLFKTLMIVAICGATIGMVSCKKDANGDDDNELVGGFDQNGASNAVFSITKGDYGYDPVKVRFSRGNLQYQASTNTWRFAEHQWDYVGEANSNISSSYTGWIDLFGWATSGLNTGARTYQPWSTSTDWSSYVIDGSAGYQWRNNQNADWGNNRISNGGNQAGVWHTLSRDDWNCLLSERSASTINGVANARYIKAIVNGVNGLVLFPDTFTMPSGINNPSEINSDSAPYNSNTYTESQWSQMEDAGCIFLPAAGERHGTDVYDAGEYGIYWTCSPSSQSSMAHRISFGDDSMVYGYNDRYFYIGYSVRLVKYKTEY